MLNLFFDRKIKTQATEQRDRQGYAKAVAREPAVMEKDRRVKMTDEGECVSKGPKILPFAEHQ